MSIDDKQKKYQSYFKQFIYEFSLQYIDKHIDLDKYDDEFKNCETIQQYELKNKNKKDIPKEQKIRLTKKTKFITIHDDATKIIAKYFVFLINEIKTCDNWNIENPDIGKFDKWLDLLIDNIETNKNYKNLSFIRFIRDLSGLYNPSKTIIEKNGCHHYIYKQLTEETSIHSILQSIIAELFMDFLKIISINTIIRRLFNFQLILNRKEILGTLKILGSFPLKLNDNIFNEIISDIPQKIRIKKEIKLEIKSESSLNYIDDFDNNNIIDYQLLNHINSLQTN